MDYYDQDEQQYNSEKESDNEQYPQQPEDNKKNQLFSNSSGVVGSSINIINTIIGAGTIGLPFVLLEYGLILGAIFILIFYFLTIFCCKLLLKCKNITGSKNYGEVGVLAYGKFGDVMIALSIVLNNFLICNIYFIVFGSNIQNIFVIVVQGKSNTGDIQGIPFVYSKKMYVLVQAIICFPFIFAKSMAFLKPASSVKMIGVFFFCFACVYNFIVQSSSSSSSNQDNSYSYFPQGKNFSGLNNVALAFKTFTSCFFAYTFHFNFYPVYLNLKQRSNKKMLKLTSVAIGIACTSFLVLSIFGYLAYGNSVQKDFFNIAEPFAKQARTTSNLLVYCLLETGYCFVCLFSLPVLYFECRNKSLRLYMELVNLYNFILGRRQKKDDPSTLRLINSNKQYNQEKQQLNQPENNKIKQEVKSPEKRGTINKESVESSQKLQKSDNETDLVSKPFFIVFSIILYIALVLLGLFLEPANMGILYDLTSAICSTLVAFIGPTAFYVKLTKNRGVYFYSALVLLLFSIICAGLAVFGIIVYKASSS